MVVRDVANVDTPDRYRLAALNGEKHWCVLNDLQNRYGWIRFPFSPLMLSPMDSERDLLNLAIVFESQRKRYVRFF